MSSPTRTPTFLLAALTLTVLARVGLDAAAGDTPAPVAAPSPDAFWGPADTVRFALGDATAVANADPEQARQRRYLASYHLPRAERRKLAETVSFVVNSLSREKVIARPTFLPGSDETVLAVDLEAYGIDPAVWDTLAEKGSGPAASATPDPYFHALLVTEQDEYKDQEYGRWNYDNYGKKTWTTLETRREKTGRRIKKKTLATAPWLAVNDGGAAIAALVELTGTSSPILRADWFVAMATWEPRYHEFLGLGDKKADFERLIFSDEKLAQKARSQTKGAALFSSVALHNRTLLRTPTVGLAIGGYFWESHDFAKSVAEDDVVNNLLEKGATPAAEELIGSLANGLQAYFIVDGKDKRLDKADADVAIDNETALQDKQVWTARNCMTCHSGGMRKIDDEARALAQRNIALLAAKGSPEAKKDAKQIQDLFFANDLGVILAHDSAVFLAAVRQCNGLDGAANGRQFEAVVRRYLDEPLTLETVAAEAGTVPMRLRGILERSAGIDHSLTGLLQVPPRLLRRDQMEAVFPQLMTLLGNVK